MAYRKLLPGQPGLAEAAGKAERVMLKKILLFLINFYRKFISPYTPDSCIYTPTCSMYITGSQYMQYLGENALINVIGQDSLSGIQTIYLLINFDTISNQNSISYHSPTSLR